MFNLKYRMKRGSIRRGINCQKGMNQYLQAVLLLDVIIDEPVRLSLLVAAYRAIPIYAMLPMPLAHHTCQGCTEFLQKL
jgi:hypothetical protein